MRISHAVPALALSLMAAFTLSACDKGTPTPGQGAEGTVAMKDAEPGEMPKPTGPAGGPAGQTPSYGEAGQAGTMVPSESPAEAQSRAAH